MNKTHPVVAMATFFFFAHLVLFRASLQLNKIFLFCMFFFLKAPEMNDFLTISAGVLHKISENFVRRFVPD